MALLGEVVATGGILEALTDVLFANMLGVPVAVGKRVCGGANFQWVLDRLLVLVELDLDEDYAPKLTEWVHDARSAYKRRNDLVHGARLASEDGPTVIVSGRVRGNKFKSEKHDAGLAVQQQVLDQLEDLVARWPFLIRSEPRRWRVA